jgi:hypothetical protein
VGTISGASTLRGTGRYTWANGTTYEGSFFGGEPAGTGRVFLPDGTSWRGRVDAGWLVR